MMPPERPSVPHHMRVPTDRQRAVARGEAESTRESRTITISLDEVPEDLQAFARSTGLSVETLIKGFSLGSKIAVALTRADDKLVIDLEKGKLGEKLDSMILTAAGKKRISWWAQIIGLIIASALAAGQALWHTVEPRAREAAEVAVIAPAIEAKRVATVVSETTDDHEARLSKVEENQAEILAAIEKLNGAIVMVVDRLPPPEPTRIEVPRRKRGIDE